MRPGRLILVAAALVASLVLMPHTADAKPRTSTASSGADCTLPESDAEALVILNYYYPNRYVWEDAHLTVAVQAAPNVSEEHVAAAQAAIASWDLVLRDCFDGQITLTDVTGQGRRSADIVLHYVPHAGGAVLRWCIPQRRTPGRWQISFSATCSNCSARGAFLAITRIRLPSSSEFATPSAACN